MAESNEIDDWEFKALQTRYEATYSLKLTTDQAKQVHQYEQEKNTYFDKHYFSAWEDWDYEMTIFKEILTKEQLVIYEASLKQNIQRYEQSLIKQDSRRANEIAYHEELIHYYETHFLPELFNDFFLRLGWLSNDRANVEYIKTEYKRFLGDTKKEILVSHFRHNRTFKPNELKASLLRHRLSYIFPDYTSFKHQMDEPTKAVAHFLQKRLRYLPDETDELLTRKFQELKEFNEANFKKHHEDIGGWHVVVGRLIPEEEKEYRIMTLLLVDKDKYGYK